MRLIDADTLKAEFTGNFQERWHYTGIRAVIENAPTIDAVPVVRCKDCVRSTVHLDHLYCEGLFACVQKDWYCASGKRKDDP